MNQKKFQEFVVNKLTNMSQDMESMKGDVSSLNVRMTAQEKFQEFATNSLTSLKNDVSSLNSRTTEQENFRELAVKYLMNLSERMSSVESTVLRIETRMEHEIIDKIQVLFDGHQQHDCRLDRIEKKLGLNM